MIALLLALTASGQSIDWDAIGDETTQLLSHYVQVDTVNPPGNETRGAVYLAEHLREVGIESEIVEFAPNRGSLIARVEGTGEAPPLCLLSHIDVVTSEASEWSHPPLGGVIEDGELWGRGVLDMKGMGILQLQVMRLLARHEVPLKRDVVLLAVADEEIDNQGMRFVIEEHWDRIGCSHVVNEGGIGLVDMLFDGQTMFPISVGEKGVLWGRLVASGEPGHGSTPVDDESPERLHAAVSKLFERKAKPIYHPMFLEMLRSAGEHEGGLAGGILQSEALVKLLLRGRLMSNPLTRAAITNTIHVTGYGGALQPNVIPVESWVNIDARLQPGTTAEDIEAEIEALIDDPNVRFERISVDLAAVSEWDDPLYRALAARAVEDRPDAVAGPVISVGFTDSIFLRQLGVRAYGLVPFAVDQEHVRGMHGNDERVPVAEIHRGVQVLYRAVVDFAAVEGFEPG